MAGLLDVLSSDGREPAEALPLPSVAMHSYLPSSSERPSIAEQVRTIAPEQIRQNEIPLIPLDGVVLYPGETLPLRIRGEAKKRLVSELYREGPVESTPKASNAADGTAATPKLGVLLRPQHRSYGDLWCVHKVGTFVDVMSISHPAVNEGEDTEVVVVCRGATRFKVVSPPCRRRGVLWAPVALMADSRLPPFHQVLPRGPRFCRNSAKLWRKHSSGVGEPPARESLKLVTRHEKLPRYELTFHSSWLWRAQCPWVLQARAKSLLLSTAAWRGIGNSATHSSSYNHHHRSGDNSLSVSDDDDDNNNINSSGGATDSGPRSSNKLVADANDISNPVGFSYWMARNLPLNDATRQELLAAPSVVHRLKQILTIVEASANSRLVCQNCGTAVGAKSAVFAVTGAEGTVGAYVNPHGIVHQTVTLREVFNVLLHGPAVEQDSWFPGYAWTIAYCATCFSHLGWRFTPVQPAASDSTPSSSTTTTTTTPSAVPQDERTPFWGLRRGQLTDESEPAEAAHVDGDEDESSDSERSSYLSSDYEDGLDEDDESSLV